jgi:hypothetical protein
LSTEPFLKLPENLIARERHNSVNGMDSRCVDEISRGGSSPPAFSSEGC